VTLDRSAANPRVLADPGAWSSAYERHLRGDVAIRPMMRGLRSVDVELASGHGVGSKNRSPGQPRVATI